MAYEVHSIHGLAPDFHSMVGSHHRHGSHMVYDVHSIHGLGVFLELISKRFRPKMFGNFVSLVCLAVQAIFHFAWQHLYFDCNIL